MKQFIEYTNVGGKVKLHGNDKQHPKVGELIMKNNKPIGVVQKVLSGENRLYETIFMGKEMVKFKIAKNK